MAEGGESKTKVVAKRYEREKRKKCVKIKRKESSSLRRRKIEWTYTRMYKLAREKKPLRISGSVRGEVACVEEEGDEE